MDKKETYNRPPPAPWRPLFESHICKMPAAEFSLATLSRGSNGNVCPRVRTCIFRSFWAELNLRDSAREEMERGDLSSESGGGGMNPVVYESDMLTFTTDVRMEKVRQIEGGEGGDGDVGGEVEAVFWVKDVMTQWRVKGRAFVVGGESGDRIEEANRARIWAGMRARWAEGEGSTGSGPWSWEKEVTAHFANMSPIMRGTFKNPPPGSPRSAPYDPSLQFGQKVYNLHDPVARANFRVVVIQPWEVEYVDLSDMKRFRWVLDPGELEESVERRWEVEELWP